jgi:hypothetical protein
METLHTTMLPTMLSIQMTKVRTIHIITIITQEQACRIMG